MWIVCLISFKQKLYWSVSLTWWIYSTDPTVSFYFPEMSFRTSLSIIPPPPPPRIKVCTKLLLRIQAICCRFNWNLKWLSFKQRPDLFSEKKKIKNGPCTFKTQICNRILSISCTILSSTSIQNLVIFQSIYNLNAYTLHPALGNN